jgi:hypothetical protein
MVLTACAVLAALILCIAAAFARPAWPRAAGVILLSVLWPLVNKPLEGPTLWTQSDDHGLTVGDLLAPACLILGLWLLRRALSGRSRLAEAPRQP